MAELRQVPEVLLKRTFKDSVFTSLFSERANALELYRFLHPEDVGVQVDDVEIVTVQNTLTTDQHNDLGFVVGDRLLVLVEAQSTWSPNIVLRALLYAAQTLKNIIREREIDVYAATPADVPRPELYVVYTGSRRDVPRELRLTETLGWSEGAVRESVVRVIDDAGSSLAGQYIDFARTMDACRGEFGPSEEAIRAGIADCVARGVLEAWLFDHEKEVVSIMMAPYDEHEVLHSCIASQRPCSPRTSCSTTSRSACWVLTPSLR